MSYSIYTNTTNSINMNVPMERKSDMRSSVTQLPEGFVGVVFTTVNHEDVAVAKTRAYKTYDRANAAGNKLAVKIAKNV